ncbi:MAG: TetR/AcrR family transcriptional regulator [Alphaproteobacteria bacterium]|nr:TetR/AcrR family transcriptional regulator [Alphaproteobacteria bacterium]
MAKRPAAKAKNKTKKKRPARAYHHGNLREALVEATLRLFEEGGPEAVTVREAARRAGVSSGAPFRHFPNRTVLMTAVAEEATHRLYARVMAAVDASQPAMAQLRAIGRAYLGWASDNPTHFAVVSNRSLIDYDSSASMKRENEELQLVMSRLLDDAGAPAGANLNARAFIYGLARMRIDGHLPQWGVAKPRDSRAAMEAALDLFLEGLVRPKG